MSRCDGFKAKSTPFRTNMGVPAKPPARLRTKHRDYVIVTSKYRITTVLTSNGKFPGVDRRSCKKIDFLLVNILLNSCRLRGDFGQHSGIEERKLDWCNNTYDVLSTRQLSCQNTVQTQTINTFDFLLNNLNLVQHLSWSRCEFVDVIKHWLHVVENLVGCFRVGQI